jgi:transcriptional regulator with XRE-family HTH domain
MPAPSSVGREIRRLREAAGITLAELSSRTGVRVAYLAAIEDDREEPSAGTLRRLVRQLDPSGTSDDALARLLTAPEFDITGEYAHDGPAGTGAPALSGDDSGAQRPLTPELDGIVSGVSEPRRETRVESDVLQFDRVTSESSSSAAPSKLAVICSGCGTSIETEYFEVNGKIVCGRCRGALESMAETPRGIGPLIIAGGFGLGAGVVGAVIYYAVIAIAHLEIGIVAILIGYMVGYAVRKGARGRGGRRFQILAVALTYASVGLAYTPVVLGTLDADRTAQNAAATSSSGPAAEAAASGPAPTAKQSGGRLLLALVFLSAFIAALPVLVVLGSFPSGLISAIIIFVGMRQAWRMTGAPLLQILGPYRVGAAPVSASV